MSQCLSDSVLHRYHTKELDGAEKARVREHLSKCEKCTRRSESLLAEHEELLGHLRGMSLPETEKLGREVPIADAASGETLEVRKPGEPSSFAPPPDSFPGYTIIREVHRGGQGVVYQALQQSTKRKVAIKVLLEGPYASDKTRRRFEREIELVASLKHANIIEVFHSGIATDGRHFYVMDYVRGMPLHRYVREKQLPLENALKLFSTVCEAVNYAHQKGVIHRDLKPTNILVDSNGHPKVLDFGLAKMVGGPEQTIVSLTGQVVGTLPYMSPEQAKGNPDEIDIRTDVYALGVILYEILTGQYPYPVAGQMAEVLKHIAETPPTPPSRQWTPDGGVGSKSGRRPRRSKCPIDNEVQTIVLKALAKERERRYQSAGEMAHDIAQYMAGEPIQARRDSGWYLLKTLIRRYKTRAAILILSCFTIVALLGTVQLIGLVRIGKRELAQLRSVVSRENIRLAHRSWQLNHITQMKGLLAECPEEHRGFAWHYLDRLSEGGYQTIEMGKPGSNRARFCGRGEQIAVETTRGPLAHPRAMIRRRCGLQMWDSATGKPLGDLGEDVLEGVVGLGSHVVATNGDVVLVWEPVTASILHRFGCGGEVITAVAASPDGTKVAAANARAMWIWDATTGEKVGSMKAVTDSSSPWGPDYVAPQPSKPSGDWEVWRWPCVIRFGPANSDLIAHNNDQTVSIWRVSSGERVLGIPVCDPSEVGAIQRIKLGSVMREHGARLTPLLTLNADASAVIAETPEGIVKAWNISTGEERASLPIGHYVGRCAVAVSGDSRWLASGNADGSVEIWDANALQIRFAGREQAGSIYCLAFSPDGGRLASGGKDGSIVLWDVEKRSSPSTLRGHEAPVWSVEFSLDGTKLVSASRDGVIKIWDLVGRRAAKSTLRLTDERASPAHARRAYELFGRPTTVASRDARFAAFASGGSICVMNLMTGQRRRFDALDDQASRVQRDRGAPTVIPATSIALSGDGELLGVQWASVPHIDIYVVRTGELLMQIPSRNGIPVLAFGPNGKLLAVCSFTSANEGWFTVADTTERRVVVGSDFVIDQEPMGVTAGLAVALGVRHPIAFSHDGTRVVVGAIKEPRVFDVMTGKVRLKLEPVQGMVTGQITFSPCDSLIFSGVPGGIARWDAHKGHLQGIISTRQESAVPPRWSPSPESDDLFRRFGREIDAIAFSPDGSLLAVGGWGAEVLLLDRGTSGVVLSLSGHASPIDALVFSPDGGELWGFTGHDAVVWDGSPRR